MRRNTSSSSPASLNMPSTFQRSRDTRSITACANAPALALSAAILASNLEPPVFKCPNCGGALEFDDLPERYFAFLQDDTD